MDMPGMQWGYNQPVSFEFEIADTLPKNVYVNVRHSFYFGWRNVWMKMALTFPNDSVYEMPLNIQLSQPNGKWFGKCSNDICFYQYPLPDFSNYSFSDTGKYLVKLTQDMRQNPLPEIISIGVRVENAIEKP
jgi:gliding motility-associated lipoprotein GldH